MHCFSIFSWFYFLGFLLHLFSSCYPIISMGVFLSVSIGGSTVDCTIAFPLVLNMTHVQCSCGGRTWLRSMANVSINICYLFTATGTFVPIRTSACHKVPRVTYFAQRDLVLVILGVERLLEHSPSRTWRGTTGCAPPGQCVWRDWTAAAARQRSVREPPGHGGARTRSRSACVV